METLSSDSRQPPDGHEFPDYVESGSESASDKLVCDYYNNPFKSSSNESNSFNNYYQNVPMQSSLKKMNSVSNSDLSSVVNLRESFESGDEIRLRRNSLDPSLHTRSQSLIDMSTISKQQKSDRWSLLAEQRKKGYSKLKGLVIPEHISESEVAPAVNIPEIISHTTPSFVLETKNNANETIQCHLNGTEPVVLPLTSPPWTSNTSTFPKYSPAFKRKSLQIYPHHKKEEPQTAIKQEKSATLKKVDVELKLDNLSDSPKSLESITSPTRSDCSFDYVTNTFAKNKNNKQEQMKYKESSNYTLKLNKDVGKSEDESDNDSAVSSSQSSYISRCSPPPSPTRSCDMLDFDSNQTKIDNTNLQCRLLKAASVEAINRKNILASAKCRSGRDLKVGSPVIQRKYEEDSTKETTEEQIPKEENCHQSVKEQWSINNEEKLITPVINGNTIQKSVSVDLKPSPPKSNNLVTLKPVVRKNVSKIETSSIKTTNVLKNNKSMSVTDLRKSFEKFGTTPPPLPQNIPKPITTNVSKGTKLTNVRDEKVKNKFRKSQEIQIEPEPVPKPVLKITNEEKVSNDGKQKKIVLYPEFEGGSIGITLAGGTDYETKEITVHKIRDGSVAYLDGRLKKGNKIVSINGKKTAGLTHAESVELLKEPVSKFVLIVENGNKEEAPISSSRRNTMTHEILEPKVPVQVQPARNVTHVIKFIKDGTGLGFSIEGGKDTPQGDLPLRVKKIFLGGPAEKNGDLQIGDELLAINDISLTNMSKMETWSLMKKLPDGDVSIHIHR